MAVVVPGIFPSVAAKLLGTPVAAVVPGIFASAAAEIPGATATVGVPGIPAAAEAKIPGASKQELEATFPRNRLFRAFRLVNYPDYVDEAVRFPTRGCVMGGAWTTWRSPAEGRAQWQMPRRL